jgi:hypothetical protein
MKDRTELNERNVAALERLIGQSCSGPAGSVVTG